MHRLSFLKLIERLRIPVIQAPMAGGINNPDFVSKMSKAGGVGSFGFGYSKPVDVEKQMTEAIKLHDGIFNANFFIFPPVVNGSNASKLSEIESRLQSIMSIGNFPSLTLPTEPYYPNLDESLEPIWNLKPKLLSFHFGIPTVEHLKKAHTNNILVGVTATSLEEARMVDRAGAAFVVAQGVEAGGHRGNFVSQETEERLTTLELVKRIRKEVGGLPIVAAGGIMTGKDIAVMMAAGASAVQMGTAFLVCDESSASPAHKRAILTEHFRDTVFTSAFSGRPARCLSNQFEVSMGGTPVLPFPLQNSLTGAMRSHAVQTDNAEFQSMYTGSNYRSARALPVAELMALLQTEYEQYKQV